MDVWVYYHTTHMNCCDCSYDNFQRLTTVQEIHESAANDCTLNDHYMLKAFFSDNVALAEFYQNKVDKADHEPSDEASAADDHEVQFYRSQLKVLNEILQQAEVKSDHELYMYHTRGYLRSMGCNFPKMIGRRD